MSTIACLLHHIKSHYITLYCIILHLITSLTDSVPFLLPVLSLKVMAGVPVGVKDHHLVGSGHVQPKASRPANSNKKSK